MQKLIYCFSKHSHRNTVPHLLKDPRFTKRGYQKTNSLGRVSRTPTIPNNILNAELYFDYTKAQELQKSAFWRQKYELTELQDILNLLTNETYLRKQDMKLMKAMKLMMIHHPKEIKNNWESFNRAFQIILSNVRYLDIYNYKQFTKIAQTYYDNEREVWTILYKNMIPFINAYEQDQTPLLSQVIKKDDQQCFFYIFEKVMKKAREYKFDVQHLVMALDIMTRNHLRFPIHGQEIYNKFENIENKNQLKAFLENYQYVMEKRTDYFNQYDEKIKKNMLKTQLAEAKKLLQQ